MADALRAAGVESVNISLDTLDQKSIRKLPVAIFMNRFSVESTQRSLRAFGSQIEHRFDARSKRGPADCADTIRGSRDLILRFIEMMPVGTTEVLDDRNFMPVNEAKRMIEVTLWSL